MAVPLVVLKTLASAGVARVIAAIKEIAMRVKLNLTTKTEQVQVRTDPEQALADWKNDRFDFQFLKKPRSVKAEYRIRS